MDKGQFSGQSTLITVTARTSAIATRGPQSGMIELSKAGQRMYIPVRLDVWQAPAPPPPAPSPLRPARRPVYRASARPAIVRATRSLDSARFALSIIVALALAIGLPWTLQSLLGSWMAGYLPSGFAVALTFLGLSALIATGGALVPYIGGQRVPGRGRTAILGAIIGGALAFNLTSQLLLASTVVEAVFPETSQVGVLAVTLPVLAAIGAALGAQTHVSHGLRAIARAIGEHVGFMLATSAILGGWLGFTITQASLTAAFHPTPEILIVLSGCGLLLGVAVGLSLAAPIGGIARSFAKARP